MQNGFSVLSFRIRSAGGHRIYLWVSLFRVRLFAHEHFIKADGRIVIDDDDDDACTLCDLAV